ncbi:MAG: VirB4 family type IV secretion/conjugal transfer ATPase [Rhodomicrobium sp.]|nr:VirB4 family type IV secretion/conjugal transfer ATPase [Rhodomicrobium sp.]
MGDRLPYLRHANEHTLLLRNGMLMQSILLEGFPFETADTEELNYRLAVRETMLRSIATSRIALYHHVIRRRASAALLSSFKDTLCGHLDRTWQARLSAQNLFVNDLFLTLVQKPSVGARRRRGPDARDARALDAATESLIASLAPYRPRLLACYDSPSGVCSEPLEFLSLLLNGDLHPTLLPKGDIGRHLPYKRLSFGLEAFELRGAHQPCFGALLSLKEYPASTTPGMIDNLLRLPFEMVITESFAFADRQHAQERIDLAIRRLRAADDETATLRRGLAEAKDKVVAGQAGFGQHHLSVLVRADEFASLDGAAAQALAAVADVGAIAVREELNLEPCFWAQFPGNLDYVARRAMISTANFAGLCSLHGFPIGAPDGNHWGQAVSVFETTSATPYFFSFHEGDLGNFVVIGPSGSGKTVVLNFLIAQAQKFEPRTVLFDKDRGAEIFIRAIGGAYDIIRQGRPTGFNPLQLADTPSNRAFLRTWIAELVKTGGALSAEEQTVIADAVAASFDQPLEMRRLCFFQELLGGFARPNANDLAARMARWCACGEHAWLFDNQQDQVSGDSRIVGFDMTDLLDSPEVRTPTMMYLFHRVEERLDGSPALIVIDEGWKALDDETFASRLRDWLKTIRKRNGVVGFCTQSARDALESRIASAITEQTAVQIFMPNPRAQGDEHCGGFGLSGHELEIVRSLPEHSRCFLIKKGGESVVARLDLSGSPHIVRILSGREQTVRSLDRLRAELGDAPEKWLPSFLREGRAGGSHVEAPSRVAQGRR